MMCYGTNISELHQDDVVELLIKITDNHGNPIEGTFSLSVADADVVKPDSVQPMLDSYMLLNSELKGHIENPNYYFADDSRRSAHHLDLLMMTQGWRRYNLNNIIKGEYPDITHSIETGQTISGEVKGTMGNKVKNVILHLLNSQNGRRDIMKLEDSERFIITGMNYVDGTTFILQAIGESGKHETLELLVDTFTFPDIAPYSNMVKQREAQLIPRTFIKLSKEQEVMWNDDVIELDEVVKTTKRIYMSRGRLNIEPPRGLAEGDAKIGRFSSMISMLTWFGMKKQMTDNGEILVHALNRSSLLTVSPVKIYVDNHPSNLDYVAHHIEPSHVKSIEYFPPGDSRLLVYGNDAVHGGLLLVFLKDGTELRESLPLSMKSITPKGYKPEVEFYSPQYPAKDKSIYTRPDHRTTLYWNPRVATNEEGKASVSFYSSDVSKKYFVTVEGISEDGMMVSEVLNIQ